MFVSGCYCIVLGITRSMATATRIRTPVVPLGETNSPSRLRAYLHGVPSHHLGGFNEEKKANNIFSLSKLCRLCAKMLKEIIPPKIF